MSERKEALMRVVVLFISGIILMLWRMLIKFLIVVHWVLVLVTNKKNKDLATFCEIWNTQIYIFLRYITFVTNNRPFPFTPLSKNMSKFKK